MPESVAPRPKSSIARFIEIIEYAGLVLILGLTVVAVGQELWVVIEARKVTLADLLLLFIYLEVIAMVGIYFESHSLPVRYPIYIAMVALARYIILDAKNLDAWQLLEVALSIFVLTMTVFLIRYGRVKYPYTRQSDVTD